MTGRGRLNVELNGRGGPAEDDPDRVATSSPSLWSRCGIVDSKEIESPGPSTYSSKPTVTPSCAADHDAELAALVADELPVGAGGAADLVDRVEELDVAVVPGRQPLPVHAGLELDHAPVGGALDPPSGPAVGRRAGRAARPRGPRPRPQSPRRRREQVVERHAELADHCVERPHRRLDLPGLDLRDEARRHLEPPRELAQAQAEPISRSHAAGCRGCPPPTEPARATRSACRSSLELADARPAMAPASFFARGAISAFTSAMEAKPPDAITGIEMLSASATVASRLSPFSSRPARCR